MKKETKHIIRTLGTILFILYVLALIYFLFFSEEYGRAAMEERQYRYNLIPFVEIRRFWVYRKQLGLMAVVTNLFGNVIGFLPFGFILPVILDKMRSGWLIVLAGFGLSVTVEVIQLITKVGCFDVDDMILNTAGAALGYSAFCYLRSPEEKNLWQKDIDMRLQRKERHSRENCQQCWRLFHWFYL